MPKSKSTSLRDVAERAGVSLTTASMAMRHHPRISAPTSEKVWQAVKELGYVPNAAMRTAMTRIRKPDAETTGDHFYWVSPAAQGSEESRKYEYATETALQQGYKMNYFQLKGDGWKEIKNFRKMVEFQGVQGVLIDQMGPRQFSVDSAFLKGLHVVSIDEGTESSPGFCRVIPDAASMMCQALSLIKERGYQRPGLLVNHWLDKEWRLRHNYFGLCHVMGFANAAPPLHFRDVSREHEMTDWLEEYQPDVVVCHLEHQAKTLYEVMQKRNLNIGTVNLFTPYNTEHPCAQWEQVAVSTKSIMQAAVSQLVTMVQHGPNWEMFKVGTMMIAPERRPGNSLELQNMPLQGNHFRISDKDRRQLICLDLHKSLNQGFTGENGWFGRHTQKDFKPGERVCAGIPFRIEPGERNFILMRSKNIQQGQQGRLPEKVTLPLPDARSRIRAIYLLHAAANAEAAQVFAQYVFVYSDGTRKKIPLACATNGQLQPLPSPLPPHSRIQDWWIGAPTLETTEVKPVPLSIAGTFERYAGCAYVYRWRNPCPAKKLSAIEIEAIPETPTNLGVLGITLLLKDG